MIDEKYHIDDFDVEMDEKIDDEPTFKSKIIFENASSSDENGKQAGKDEQGNLDIQDSKSEVGNIDIQENINKQPSDEQHDNKEFNEGYVNKPNFFNRFIEGFVIQSYNERPNTFKWTISGIIISILIMYIGFWKAMIISAVVLIANIIGQLIDGSPRLLQVIEQMNRRFR